MTKKQSPPFLHQPYDGSSLPFTVGLKPIDEEVWLEPDAHLAVHLAEKERLIDQKRASVFRAEDGTDAAQSEVLDLVLDNLGRFHTNTHLIAPDLIQIPSTERTILRSDVPPLLTAARILQEDLVIMRASPEGYRLAAAVLCFPSSWSLAEKIGQPMTGIHEKVPGFNEGRMGKVVARVFENLQSEQLLCRFNWSIYPDEQLHHPHPERVHLDDPDHALANLFLRVERQTLRRLPGSGDILFTIKVHHDPLAALEASEDKSELARSLRKQLLSLDHDQLAYKGLNQSHDALAEALEKLSAQS
jgi:heme-dependent oxidative N-demethylase alpha subunit-like protein